MRQYGTITDGVLNMKMTGNLNSSEKVVDLEAETKSKKTLFEIEAF